MTFDQAIDAIADIPNGTMSREEDAFLFWAARLAGIGACILEIGTYKGRSAALMALANPTAGISTVERLKGKRKIAEDHFERLGITNRITTIQGDSPSALPLGDFDFIFIDGNHNHPHVDKDIKAAHKRLSPSGILSGHDYGRKRFDVKDAVDKLLPNLKFKPVSVVDSVWFSTRIPK